MLVEEPENHIAPHILGRVIKILKEIATEPNAMVFMSSHTPAIIKRIEVESIFHFRIGAGEQTEVNDIELPPSSWQAYKYIKEAIQNYPEIYLGGWGRVKYVLEELIAVKDDRNLVLANSPEPPRCKCLRLV